MRARFGLCLLAASAGLALAGCGGSEDTSGPGQGTSSNAATTTTADGINALVGAGTHPVTGTTSATDTALLERIDVGRHEGYDRVVFQFRNQLPGYRVEYAQPPFAEDGSGNPVDVDGSAFVAVRMEPASGFDLQTSEGQMVYTGPKRIAAADRGTSIVRELARTGDFEAVLSWVIGLEERVDFRVLELDSPPRLVVDFRNR